MNYNGTKSFINSGNVPDKIYFAGSFNIFKLNKPNNPL